MSGVGEQFRDAVLARDMEAAAVLLSEDVVFRSPAVFKPYQGRTATMVILRSVLRIAEDFRVMMRPLSGLNVVVARMGEVIPQTMKEMGPSQ